MAEVAEGEILLRILGEISDVQEKLATVASGLEGVAQKTEEVKEAGSAMSSGMSGSAAGMRGLVSVVRQVNPAMGRMASVVMGASRAMKGFGIAVGAVIRAIGPLAAAAAVGYGAYEIFTRETKKAKEISEQFADIQSRVQAAINSTTATLIRAKVITGELGAAEAAQIVNAATVQETYGAVTESIEEAVAARERELSTMRQELTTQQNINRIRARDFRTQEPMPHSAADILRVQNALADLREQQMNATIGAHELNEALNILSGSEGGGAPGATEALKDLKLVLASLPKDYEETAVIVKDAKKAMSAGAKDTAKTEEDSAAQTLSAYASIANSAGKLNEALGGDAQEQFRRGQALALAEVGFNTASAVMQALPNVALSIAMGAAGAANAALVMAQQPPSAHMGLVPSSGPLAPDEMNTRVLKGEAVLDRATVRRMGGGSGVRDLMQGSGGNGQTVVVVPWKHLDRELQSSGRANSRFGRTMRRNAQISTGQRG